MFIVVTPDRSDFAIHGDSGFNYISISEPGILRESANISEIINKHFLLSEQVINKHTVI